MGFPSGLGRAEVRVAVRVRVRVRVRARLGSLDHGFDGWGQGKG